MIKWMTDKHNSVCDDRLNVVYLTEFSMPLEYVQAVVCYHVSKFGALWTQDDTEGTLFNSQLINTAYHCCCCYA